MKQHTHSTMWLMIFISVIVNIVQTDMVREMQDRLDKIETSLQTSPVSEADTADESTANTTTETVPEVELSTTTTVPHSVEEDIILDSIATCEEYKGRKGMDYLASVNAPSNPEPFFFGTCDGESMWFWAYPGTSSDVYKMTVPPDVSYDEYGVMRMPLVGNDAGLPTNAHHPAYADAMTLNDAMSLAPGSLVCSWSGSRPMTTWALEKVLLYTYFYPSVMSDPVVYPALEMNPVYDGKSTNAVLPATDLGVSPYEEGIWSVAHATIGTCPTT